jgi:hypothetical protein
LSWLREGEGEEDEEETRKRRGWGEGGRVIVETGLRRSVKSGQQMLA